MCHLLGLLIRLRIRTTAERTAFISTDVTAVTICRLLTIATYMARDARANLPARDFGPSFTAALAHGQVKKRLFIDHAAANTLGDAETPRY